MPSMFEQMIASQTAPSLLTDVRQQTALSAKSSIRFDDILKLTQSNNSDSDISSRPLPILSSNSSPRILGEVGKKFFTPSTAGQNSPQASDNNDDRRVAQTDQDNRDAGQAADDNDTQVRNTDRRTDRADTADRLDKKDKIQVRALKGRQDAQIESTAIASDKNEEAQAVAQTADAQAAQTDQAAVQLASDVVDAQNATQDPKAFFAQMQNLLTATSTPEAAPVENNKIPNPTQGTIAATTAKPILPDNLSDEQKNIIAQKLQQQGLSKEQIGKFFAQLSQNQPQSKDDQESPKTIGEIFESLAASAKNQAGATTSKAQNTSVKSVEASPQDGYKSTDQIPDQTLISLAQNIASSQQAPTDPKDAQTDVADAATTTAITNQDQLNQALTNQAAGSTIVVTPQSVRVENAKNTDLKDTQKQIAFADQLDANQALKSDDATAANSGKTVQDLHQEVQEKFGQKIAITLAPEQAPQAVTPAHKNLDQSTQQALLGLQEGAANDNGSGNASSNSNQNAQGQNLAHQQNVNPLIADKSTPPVEPKLAAIPVINPALKAPVQTDSQADKPTPTITAMDQIKPSSPHAVVQNNGPIPQVAQNNNQPVTAPTTPDDKAFAMAAAAASDQAPSIDTAAPILSDSSTQVSALDGIKTDGSNLQPQTDLSKANQLTDTIKKSDTSVQRSAVTEQVNSSLQQGLRKNLDHIKIQLTPDNLGVVDVKMSIDKAGYVKATVSSNEAQTLQFLKQDSSSLQQVFEKAGLKTDSESLQFSMNDNANQNFARQQNDNRQRQNMGENFSNTLNGRQGDSSNVVDLPTASKRPAPVFNGGITQHLNMVI